jgi:hypothetical protein
MLQVLVVVGVFTHTARPPPHTNYFTYQDWKKTHPHLYAESPILTTHKTTNPEPAEQKTNSIKSTSIPLKTSSAAHINNYNSIWIILKTTRSR